MKETKRHCMCGVRSEKLGCSFKAVTVFSIPIGHHRVDGRFLEWPVCVCKHARVGQCKRVIVRVGLCVGDM